MGDAIKYMGTSTVARDIDYLTTLLDGEDALMYVDTLISISRRLVDHLLPFSNFYGLSYGTVMGQYLVNMCVLMGYICEFVSHPSLGSPIVSAASLLTEWWTPVCGPVSKLAMLDGI